MVMGILDEAVEAQELARLAVLTRDDVERDAAIVDRGSFAYTRPARGTTPYWVTNSADGAYCFVSFAGDDEVSVISYADESEVARIAVGDHPQRMRMGRFPRTGS